MFNLDPAHKHTNATGVVGKRGQSHIYSSTRGKIFTEEADT